MAATRDAGYDVDAGVIERGATWLARELDGMDPRTAAYALYALTMVGDQNILGSAQELADQASTGEVELDIFSRAALAIALLESGDAERAQPLVDGLASEAKETGDEACWPTGLEDGGYRQKSMRNHAHDGDGFGRVGADQAGASTGGESRTLVAGSKTRKELGHDPRNDLRLVDADRLSVGEPGANR